MKIIFSFLFLSALLTNTVYAVGESDTECLQMLESTERSNPKLNLEQTKQTKKPTSSGAIRG